MEVLTYNFSVDRKETIWSRDNFFVEASSQEEANEIAKELVINRENGIYDIDYHIEECGYLLDTGEYLTVEDNQGRPTVSLMTKEGDFIYENEAIEMDNVEPRMYWLDIQNNDYDDEVVHSHDAFITEAENCGNVATILKFSQMLNSGEINVNNCVFKTFIL